jgi:glutathione synthase/RimK-type ligase-like ATP-grasp enzyme
MHKKFISMRIAYISYPPTGQFGFADEENQRVFNALKQNGFTIREENWWDDGVNWQRYDCILLKAPWDYVDKIDRFYEWLVTIERLEIPMLNPLDIVRWNSDKHYLQDFQTAGLNIVPTHFLEAGAELDFAFWFSKLGTDKLIVKPCISGASKNTFAITKESAIQLSAELNILLKEQALIIQPYISQIEDGEWSLVFLAGEFSHGLLKKPVQGEFRCQQQFGGTIHSRTPGIKLLHSAYTYVDHFAKDCLYARVDGIVIEGEFYLMELELIEPVLFLDTSPKGFESYTVAFKKMVEHYFFTSKI